MSARNPKPRGLVAASQIKKWEQEYASLGRQVHKIENQRTKVKALIDAAKSLVPRDPIAVEAAPRKRKYTKRRQPPPPAVVKVAPVSTAQAPPQPKARKGRRPQKSEWKEAIREITLTSDHPVPYPEAICSHLRLSRNSRRTLKPG
jgi:hypothetical protein